MAAGRTVAVAAAAAAVAVAAAAYGLAPQGPEWEGPSEARVHGSVSTASGSPIYGSPEAGITIVEFGDYQCHQCHNWFHNTKPILFEEYVDTGVANMVFVDMAFLGRDSQPAAQASHCAGDQGAYWEYHEALYESQGQRIDDGWAGSDELKGLADGLGLDAAEFGECLDSGKYRARVQENTAEAQRFGATGTPTFLIVSEGGREQTIVGAQPYQVFKRVLDSMI